MALATLSDRPNPRQLHSVVVTTRKGLLVWQKAFHDFAPHVPVVLAARDVKWALPEDPCVVITNYGYEPRILPVAERGLLALTYDESHKLINRKNKRHQIAKTLAHRSNRVWLVTGSPIRNHPSDIIPQAMLIGATTSYWKSVERYFAVCEDPMEGRILGGVKDPDGFKRWVQSFLLRRSKKQALPGLPAKRRTVLPVRLTKRQRQAYDSLVNEMALVNDDGDLVLAPTVVAAVTRLRQLLVAPRLLGLDFDGGLEKVLREWAKDLREDGRKGVVFTPFRAAIPHLQKASGVSDFVTITGGLSTRQLERAFEAFRHPKTRLAFCTIQVSEAFSLTEASEALFAGCEWTMAANEQAEDRLHRSGQEDEVAIRYAVNEGTIEEDVLALLETKASYEQILNQLVERRNAAST